jgi:hypothetical protein
MGATGRLYHRAAGMVNVGEGRIPVHSNLIPGTYLGCGTMCPETLGVGLENAQVSKGFTAHNQDGIEPGANAHQRMVRLRVSFPR